MKSKELPERPNEGHNRFYDKRKPEDEIAGLEFAIKHTRDRIQNDPDRPKDIFENKLKELEDQLEKAKKKLGDGGKA